MIRIRLTLEGDIILDRVLAGIEARARDLTPAWPGVVRAFREIVGRAFDSEGASTGSPWPQLAERTQRDRIAKGYEPAHPILERSTTLRRSLVIGDSGGFTHMAPDALAIGSAVAYFKYHQSNKPRTRLPRRAPALFTADDRHALMRPIRLYVTGRDPNAPRRQAVG